MGEMPEEDEDEWEDVDRDPEEPPAVDAVDAGGDDAPALADDVEMEGAWEWDDIEGLLEGKPNSQLLDLRLTASVIGLIGPIANLGQNVRFCPHG